MWEHKTGSFVCTLDSRGGGGVGGGVELHFSNIRTEKSSSKLNLNISVQLPERCYHRKLAFVWNLFQKGYTSTLIDMLKHSVQQPQHCFQFTYLEFHCN